jgi:hypothetical protein
MSVLFAAVNKYDKELRLKSKTPDRIWAILGIEATVKLHPGLKMYIIVWGKRFGELRQSQIMSHQIMKLDKYLTIAPDTPIHWSTGSNGTILADRVSAIQQRGYSQILYEEMCMKGYDEDIAFLNEWIDFRFHRKVK